MPETEIPLKQIHAALEHEAHLDMQSNPIDVDCDGRTVTLSGEVPSLAAKKRALRAASAAVGGVDGVQGVVDRLRVHSPENPGDGALRDAVCELMLRDIDLLNCNLLAHVKGEAKVMRQAGGSTAASSWPSGTIEIIVEDGVVRLTGNVISLSHKRLAGVLAWWARGVRDVVNELAVIPGEEDNDDEVTDALRLVLETDPLVPADQITIRTHNNVVTLAGVVATEEERRRAEQDAWCLFAVDEVINKVEVRP